MRIRNDSSKVDPVCETRKPPGPYGTQLPLVPLFPAGVDAAEMGGDGGIGTRFHKVCYGGCAPHQSEFKRFKGVKKKKRRIHRGNDMEMIPAPRFTIRYVLCYVDRGGWGVNEGDRWLLIASLYISETINILLTL